MSFMDGMQISGDNYYESNNLQDLWLTGENFNKEDLTHKIKIWIWLENIMSL